MRERLARRPVGAAAGAAYARDMPTTTPIEDPTRRAGTELGLSDHHLYA